MITKIKSTKDISVEGYMNNERSFMIFKKDDVYDACSSKHNNFKELNLNNSKFIIHKYDVDCNFTTVNTEEKSSSDLNFINSDIVDKAFDFKLGIEIIDFNSVIKNSEYYMILLETLEDNTECIKLIKVPNNIIEYSEPLPSLIEWFDNLEIIENNDFINYNRVLSSNIKFKGIINSNNISNFKEIIKNNGSLE